MRTAYVIQDKSGYYLTGSGFFEKDQDKVRLFSRKSDAQNAINKRTMFKDDLTAIPFFCYHPGTVIAIQLASVVPVK